MKKQRKQLIILAAVLVLLAASVPCIRYFTKKQEEKAAEAQKAEEDAKVLLDAAYEDVVKFSYDYEGKNYAFQKTEDTWHAVEDSSLNIKESSMKSMLSGVTPLYVQQTIENVTDFSQYGLDQPERTIAYETASASYILYVGDYNSLTGTYYVSMPSEAKVYVVEQTVVTRFSQTYEDVTEVQEEEASEVEESVENGSEAEKEAPEDETEDEETVEDGTAEEESVEDEITEETENK